MNLRGNYLCLNTMSFNATDKLSDDAFLQKLLFRLHCQKIIHGVFLQNFNNLLKPGIRAEVQLKNKRYSGIIKKIITEKPEAFEPRPIHKYFR